MVFRNLTLRVAPGLLRDRVWEGFEVFKAKGLGWKFVIKVYLYRPGQPDEFQADLPGVAPRGGGPFPPPPPLWLGQWGTLGGTK